MKTSPISYRFALGALALVLAVAPASALDQVIDSGLDLWITRSSATFVGFDSDPLPADFFCSGSQPFAGKIGFQGVPVATQPAGALGRSDTILQRLDDAVFDENGIAVTRLQIRALQFEATEVFRNECGAFQVRVGLNGEQPITEMRIVRESPNGGRFEAEVAVNAKIVFTPVDHAGPALEVGREIRFPPRRNSYWAHRAGGDAVQFEGFVVVDTDADGQPDTFLPGTSRNFAAGWPAKPDTDIFRRVDAPQSGSEVAGSLLPGVAGSLPTQPAGLRNVAGEVTYCEDNCHCDPGCGDHCLTPTCSTCEIR